MIPNITELDEILDYCLLEITAGRLSVEDCLKQYPQAAPQLAPLLQTAVMVRAVPKSPGLSTEKRRAIEQQLLNRAVQSRPLVASRQLVAPVRRPLRLRFGLVAIGLAVLLVSGGGIVTASATSLPNDVLYPVKRLTEQISLATAPSSAQANLQLNLARRRLDEFEALAARDDVRPELMDEAVIAMSSALQAAALLPEEQQKWVAETVVRLTDAQTVLAASSSATASLATRASLEASAAAAATTRERALQLVDVLPPPDSATATAPTATNTSTSTSTPITTSSITPTPSVGTPTDTALPKPTLPVVKPTDKPTKTPKPPNTPPGLVKTPNTPPGQVKTPKPDSIPPGLEDKTPKPKK